MGDPIVSWPSPAMRRLLIPLIWVASLAGAIAIDRPLANYVAEHPFGYSFELYAMFRLSGISPALDGGFNRARARRLREGLARCMAPRHVAVRRGRCERSRRRIAEDARSARASSVSPNMCFAPGPRVPLPQAAWDGPAATRRSRSALPGSCAGTIHAPRPCGWGLRWPVLSRGSPITHTSRATSSAPRSSVIRDRRRLRRSRTLPPA